MHNKIAAKNIVGGEDILKSDGTRLGASIASALQQLTDDIVIDFAGVTSISMSGSCQMFWEIFRVLGVQASDRLAFDNVSEKIMATLEMGCEEVRKKAKPSNAPAPLIKTSF